MRQLMCFGLGREAGDVYLKAGETEIKSGEADGSARKFINASTCYKKIDPECKFIGICMIFLFICCILTCNIYHVSCIICYITCIMYYMLFNMYYIPCTIHLVAIKCLLRANEVFVKNGRFHIAATHEKEIAEIYEQSLSDPENAIKFYLSAADRFSIDDSVAISQGCSIRAATICGEIGKFEEAAKLFEANAEESSSDQLRKYSVKDYLFRAGLCRLCLNVRNAQQGLVRIDLKYLFLLPV